VCTDIVALRRSKSGGAQAAFLQGTQTLLGEELLKGEQMAHQPFDGQRLELLLPVEDVEAVRLGIHLQAEAVTDQLAGDVILLEIELDHAMGIDLALHVPAIRIDDLGQGTQGRQSGKGRARGLVGPLGVVVLAKVLGHLAGLGHRSLSLTLFS
jgi:hypothetical protein